LPLVGAATALIAAGFITPHVDRYVERSKYASYDVAAAFDTPYGHQTFLVRDSSLILVTDNSIEAVLPDRETAENQFLVPLIYHPGAQEILYIGRAEFGVTQLRGFLKAVQVTAVDPRSVLTSAIEKALPAGAGIRVIADDPVAYLSRRNVSATYDIIILNPGAPDSYRVSRLFTPEFLTAAKRWLKEDGVIFIPTSYDSDRYLAPEKRDVLAILYHTLQRSFARVNVWPGTSTLFLASDRRPLDLPYDSIMARIADFPDSAVYISEAYLADRLDSLKVDRLLAAVSATSLHQEMARPLLPHYQALWRSMRNTTDRKLVDFILNRPRWLYAIPLLVAAFFVAAVGRRRDSGAFALFLYFTAGLVSLSLELISFYVYQSMAGSLYSEMALLVGAFMLGLAVGVYYSHRSGDCPLEYPALAILITSVLIFWNTYRRVGPEALLPFHILFLFVVAVATGTLFVAATNRLYGRKLTANRGAGYAWELAGSSLGAFLTMTLLLPLIGLAGLMISLLALLFLALIGAAVSRKLTGS
jgi:spermidine synthase